MLQDFFYETELYSRIGQETPISINFSSIFHLKSFKEIINCVILTINYDFHTLSQLILMKLIIGLGLNVIMYLTRKKYPLAQNVSR